MDSNIKKIAFTTGILLALAGCASNPDSSSSLGADAAQSESVSQVNAIKELLEKADANLKKSKENELDWFAGELVEEAEKSLTDAKESYSEFEFAPSEVNSSSGFFSSKTNGEAAIESIAIFDTKIAKAEEIRSNALTTLETAFDYRAQFKTIDAKKYFPNTVAELDKELKTLVDYVADGKTDSAISGQLNLVVKQRALEVKVVTTIYLADAQKHLKELQASETKDNAPKTLSQAAQAVNAAIAYVNADPRAIDEIIEKGKEADFSLNHAAQVAIAVKGLKQLSSTKYEDYILDMENLLLAISTNLGTEDTRDQSIEEQGKAIVAFIQESMKDDQAKALVLKELRAEIETQKSTLEAKSVQIDALKNELTGKSDLVTSLESKVTKLTAEKVATEALLKAQVEAKAEAKSEPEVAEVAEAKVTEAEATETTTAPAEEIEPATAQ